VTKPRPISIHDIPRRDLVRPLVIISGASYVMIRSLNAYLTAPGTQMRDASCAVCRKPVQGDPVLLMALVSALPCPGGGDHLPCTASAVHVKCDSDDDQRIAHALIASSQTCDS
jgi:hypothetical protein